MRAHNLQRGAAPVGGCAATLVTSSGEIAMPTSIGVCLELVVRRTLATTCCGQVMWLSHPAITTSVGRCRGAAVLRGCPLRSCRALPLELAGSSCIDTCCAVSAGWLAVHQLVCTVPVGWQRRAVLRLWVSAATTVPCAGQQCHCTLDMTVA